MTQTLATGIQMGESPRWHDGRLWLCDWRAGEVLALDAGGDREVMARIDGLPFSIDWLPDGRLIATTPGGVVAGPELAPYGATGQPFNEIVVDRAGRAWVDMPGSMPWEEPKPGAVTVVEPDGSSRPVAGDVWFPNGMVILGDDTLVVAESHADRLAVASPACSAATTAAASSSSPISTAGAALPTASSSCSRSPCRTPVAPDRSPATRRARACLVAGRPVPCLEKGGTWTRTCPTA